MVEVAPKPTSFGWDKGNIEKNWEKYKVVNHEVEEIFGNEPLIVSGDVKHSQTEDRFQALGKTNSNRLLFRSFINRRNKIRVISVRDMARKRR